MFKNRRQAGSLLARRLSIYKDKKDFIVLGIPRGGVVVAKKISEKLNLPLNVLVVKKIGAPNQPELAIGAVGEGGVFYLDEKVISEMKIKKEVFDKQIKSKKKQVAQRIKLFRGKTNKLEVKNMNVIVADDGIATGSTIKVAINCLRKMNPKKIILAVPVCPKETASLLENLVDKLIILKKPEEFYAVGNFYHFFPQVEDSKVVNLLK